MPLLQKTKILKKFNIDVLRLDLIDPIIGGNKWFKLSQNIQQAKIQGHKTMLSFGGPHSNHIAAMAKTCKLSGLQSIGIIRGDIAEALSPTLIVAQNNDMQLHFVNREEYRKKTEITFIENLKEQYGDFYLVPEGGNNLEGVLGCMDILKPEWEYDYIFCACGTGATYTGLVASAKTNQIIIGINVLKGKNTMPLEVEKNLNTIFKNRKFKIEGNEVLASEKVNNHSIINEYALSGYAKYDQVVIDFKKQFEMETKIILDYVYTSKLFYAVQNLLGHQKIKPNAKLLIIHSGGLQGNLAFEKKYNHKLGL